MSKNSVGDCAGVLLPSAPQCDLDPQLACREGGERSVSSGAPVSAIQRAVQIRIFESKCSHVCRCVLGFVNFVNVCESLIVLQPQNHLLPFPILHAQPSSHPLFSVVEQCCTVLASSESSQFPADHVHVECLMICDIRNGDYPYDESWSFRTWYIDLFWVICALHESWKKSSIISVMCRYNVYYKNDAFKGFDHRVCKNFATSEKLSHGSAHGGDVLRVFIPIRVGKRTRKSGCLFCMLFWTYVTSE